MSRRRSLLLRLAAAFSARRRSVATGMLRLRRSAKPTAPEPDFRSPFVAASDAAAGCGAFVGFDIVAVPHSRVVGGNGWEPGIRGQPWPARLARSYGMNGCF